MNTIRPLPQSVIAKIAAGEVIERPAYAVKELIENSLDAGADYIVIELTESGMDAIIVTDNGHGMPPGDIKKSFLPHTTSKLSDINDLDSLSTHGFRGEALSSIAAISILHIKSRTKERETGYYLKIKKGKVEKDIPFGMPVGTQVAVHDIFSSVPARKKFLKSKRVEYLHILEIVLSFAMAYPHVQFAVLNNNKKRILLPTSEERRERFNQVLGKESADKLLPVTYDDAYLSIEGYFGTPQLSSTTTRKQYIYVNNRRIYDKGITTAIKEAYGSHFDKKFHPVYMLFLTLPRDMVDINVHPRKEEVRFYHKDQLLQKINEVVSGQLAENVMVYDSPWNKLWKNSTQTYAGQILKDEDLPWKLPEIAHDVSYVQLHNLYILLETKNGLLFIDQHAAHERILFEQFSATFIKKQQTMDSMTLPKACIFETSVVEKEMLLAYLPQLQKLGFTIEQYKKDQFILSSVPLLFYDRNYNVLIEELLENLREEKKQTVDAYTHKMLTFLACRGAVKAGDTLTQEQMQELAEQLEKTPNNTTCPHGRPTKIFFDKRALDRMFKR